MSKLDKEEEKDKKKAILISIGSHVALLIFFFMIAAWTEPDPPIPEYGIELAFIGASVSNNSSQSSKPIQEQVIEEVQQQNVESQSETIEESDSETTESSAEPAEQVITEDVNSPDINENIVEDSSKEQNEVKEEDSPSQELENTEVKEETEPEIIEETEPEMIEESDPELDGRALFQNDSNNGNESGGESASAGSSLNMSGWLWDFKPEPDDKSTENGKIIFQVKVDNEGEIIGIKTLEKTVSPVVEKVYRNAVMELTFSKTASNQSTASISKGIITFIIQSR